MAALRALGECIIGCNLFRPPPRPPLSFTTKAAPMSSAAGSGVLAFVISKQSRKSLELDQPLRVWGDLIGDRPMAAGTRLIGISVVVLAATTTLSLAQNTGNPMLNGNTVNPVLSGQSTLLSARSELSVSPSTPTGLLTNTTGTNPLTGLPCTGPGSLSISGAGTLPGTTSPPVNGSDIGTASGSAQIPAFPSVFQPGGTAGAC